MKMKYYLLSVLLFWTSHLFAFDVILTAAVSKTEVAAGEQFEVTFTANGNIDGFNPPSFNGLNVLSGPNQSSSMTSINGRTSVSISLSYILMATRPGVYKIGQAMVTADGKEYRSRPLTIKVAKGSATPQSSQPSGGEYDRTVEGKDFDISKRLFIRAFASKTNPYQGEQLAVTYKLYTSVTLVDNDPPEKLPDFNGFWSQEIKTDQKNVQWTTETFNGRRYNVATIRQVILFPERSGKLYLDPLTMTFTVRMNTPSNDPIEQIFGAYKDVKYKLKSSLVTINVKPLPEAGKPESFQGAVGNFTAAARVDKTDLKANEALNYTLTVAGSGNLKLFKTPEIKVSADIEKYDPKVSDKLTESLSGVSGSRDFTYLLIPRHEGNYHLEPLKFSYFNPVTQRYVTLTTTDFNLKVAKGAAGANVTAFSSENQQQDVKLLDKDIRYIKSTADLVKAGEGFYGSAWFYVLSGFGPLLFAAAFIYRRQYRELNKDQVKVKGRNAGKVAARHLEHARKQLLSGDKNAFYEAIYRGLYGYLSDKLTISFADLNKQNITERLKARNVGDMIIAELAATIDLCEMARYAPIAGSTEQEVFDKAKYIINDIENAAA